VSSGKRHYSPSKRRLILEFTSYMAVKLQKIERRKANWPCHIYRSNYLLKRVFERKIEGKIKREIKCKQLLGDHKEKESTGFGRGTIRSHSLEKSLWKRNR